MVHFDDSGMKGTVVPRRVQTRCKSCLAVRHEAMEDEEEDQEMQGEQQYATASSTFRSIAYLHQNYFQYLSWGTHVRYFFRLSMRCCRNLLLFSCVSGAATFIVIYIMVAFCFQPLVMEYHGTFAGLSRRNQFIYIAISDNLVTFWLLVWIYVLLIQVFDGTLIDAGGRTADHIRRDQHHITGVWVVISIFLLAQQYPCKLYGYYSIMNLVDIFGFIVFTAYAFLKMHFAIRGLPNYSWYRVPLIALLMLLEIGYAILIVNWATYTLSSAFQWTAPFLFGVFATLTRRAAELTPLPVASASRLCIISIALSSTLTRVAQCIYIHDPLYFIGLEVFYTIFALFFRVTLYYRHALLSALLTGRCITRVPRERRSQHLTSKVNVAFYIIDFSVTIVTIWLRYVLDNDTLSFGVVLALFVFSIVFQAGCSVLTILIVTWYESIPVVDLYVRMWPSRRNNPILLREYVFFTTSLVALFGYNLESFIVIWYPSCSLGLN